MEKIICIGDGDNIGDVIELHLLSDRLEDAGSFSRKVRLALQNISELAQERLNASLIYVAGDDICFSSSKSLEKIQGELEYYLKYFSKKTGVTMSFGVGRNPTEALTCLRKAKVSGKGRMESYRKI